MPIPCLCSLCCCCSSIKTQTIPNSKPKPRKKHKLLRILHIYGVLTVQVVASAILIAITLWPILRFPEPLIHVRDFTVDALNNNVGNRTLLHYNFTLHNPDLYKSLQYDVLILRITYSKYGWSGPTINFNVDGKGIHQRPGETLLLSNHTANYTAYEVGWIPDDLIQLKTEKYCIELTFIIEVQFLMFGSVIGSHQMTQVGEIYFDDDGKAFIDRRGGLVLK